MKTAARIFNALGLFLIILVLLLYLLISLPQLTRLQTNEIISGSMEPAIPTGSLTFIREAGFEDIRPGDVIVFRVSGSDETVTHRVTEVHTETRELITKGDANEIEDLRPVSEECIEGKVLFSLPLLGYVEGFSTTAEGKISSACILAGAFILKILGGRLEKACRKKEQQAEEISGKTEKKSGKSTPLLDALLLLFICGALFALYKLVSPMIGHKISAVEYESLEEYVTVPAAVSTSDEPSVSGDPGGIVSSEDMHESYFPWQVDWPEVDFAELKAINPDVVAWLYIEGTQVNYPIVQGADNEYYLNRSFKGTRNALGCLFLDYRNSKDFSDLHANIYGHHINNGTMMASIVSYKSQSFYDLHPYGLLMTPDANYLIEFYSGFVAEGYDDAWQVQYSSYSQYENWLELSSARSMFESGIKPGRDDQVLTLSTCSYEFHDARFVLDGILHKEP